MLTPVSEISQTDFMMSSTNLGPDADHSVSYEFSDRVPPRLGVYGEYESYREDIYLQVNQTTLPLPSMDKLLSGDCRAKQKLQRRKLKPLKFVGIAVLTLFGINWLGCTKPMEART